jgi:hypothetical protein
MRATPPRILVECLCPIAVRLKHLNQVLPIPPGADRFRSRRLALLIICAPLRRIVEPPQAIDVRHVVDVKRCRMVGQGTHRADDRRCAADGKMLQGRNHADFRRLVTVEMRSSQVVFKVPRDLFLSGNSIRS